MSKDNTELLNRITGWADIDREKLGIPIVFYDRREDAIAVAFTVTDRYLLFDPSLFVEGAPYQDELVRLEVGRLKASPSWPLDLCGHIALKHAPTTKCQCRRCAERSTDPIDAKHDGFALRDLLQYDERNQHESGSNLHYMLTPNQRAAVSAYWSAQLRAKVDATKQAERTQVVCDWQDEP